jgi:hypothetical protein
MDTYSLPANFSSNNQEHVQQLQQLLTALGYNTGNTFTSGVYASTIGSVQSFQTSNVLPPSGNMSAETIQMLNARLNELYRVCGELKNDYGMPVEGATVLVYKTIYRGTRTAIGSGTSRGDGTYCVFLSIPEADLDTRGMLKAKINVTVEIKQDSTVKLTESNLFVQEKENRFNFSSASLTYMGKSVYGRLIELLQPYELTTTAKGAGKTSLLAQTGSSITDLAAVTGIEKETLTRLLLAEVLESKTGTASNPDCIFIQNIPEEVFFAFLHQGMPDNLPLRLITSEEERIVIGELGEYQNRMAERINIGLSLTPVEALSNILSTACKTFVIDAHSDEWINGYTAIIGNAKNGVASNSLLLEGGVAVSSIIDAAGTSLSSAQKTQLIDLFVSYIHDFDGFLDALAKLSDTYGKANVNNLILAFHTGRVVRNYIPVVKYITGKYYRIFEQYGTGIIATITPEEWRLLINQLSCPPDFEDHDAYLQFIVGNILKLYPQIAAAAQLNVLQERSFEYATQIKDVLLNNKNKNLLVDRLSDFQMDTILRQNKAFMQEIKIFQRVFRISPSPAATSALLDKGITDAAQVYYMGQECFAANFKTVLTGSEIRNTYAMATAVYAGSITAFANMSDAFRSNDPYVLPHYNIQSYIENLKEDVPDIETLFGGQEHCECSHDSSVYSPAAYLSDILRFLNEQKDAASTQSVLTFLKKRRADICKINLNARNTNTVLPYIDLVCEVLEEAVIRSINAGYTRPSETCQSTLSAEELCAAPQHILALNGKTAYDTLKDSIFPMYAPFNLEQVESRACFLKQGIARDELMETFQKKGGSLPSNTDIAAEYFGLTSLEQHVVTANLIIADRNKAWTNLEQKNSDTLLVPVSEFMRDTGLLPFQMVDIIKADWVKLSNANLITDCSFKGKNITSSPAGFDRTHRFIRLWRKSGWKMWELNLLLKNSNVTGYTNVNTDNLNASALHRLRLFSRQQKMLGLSCESLLAFYGNINTVELYENGKKQSCLYDKLFLGITVDNPVNDHLRKIKNGTATSNTDSATDEIIATSLSIGKDDYDWLKLKYTGNRDIKYLSWLYRHSILSKKLEVSLPELMTALKLFGKERGGEAYLPEETDEIIKTVNSIKDSKISVFEYEYLTLYDGVGAKAALTREASVFVPSEKQLTECIDDIYKVKFIKRPVLSDVATGTNDRWEPYRNLFLKYITDAGIYNTATGEEFVRIIEGKSSLKDKDVTLWIAAHARKMPNALLYTNQSGNLSIEDITARYNNAINWLEYKLVYESNFVANIPNRIAEFLGLSSVIVKTLLFHSEEGKESLWEQIILHYVREEGTDSDLRKILIHLHKVSLFIKKCNINSKEFELLITLQKSLNFDWFTFKTSAEESSSLTAGDLLKLAGIMELQKKYEAVEEKTLLDILAENESSESLTEEFLLNICKLTHWNIADLTVLTAQGGLNLNRQDFYNPQTYTKIQRCMQMLDRLKVPAAAIVNGTNSYSGWRIRESNTGREKAQNSAIKNAVKALYGADAWFKELELIQKSVREAKADALSSYLIAVSRRNPDENAIPIRDKNDLYGYFLLDPEMSADMKTSRIVQATCSVQLFTQRIFLNLEKVSPVTLDEYKWKQWEWMKRYRLWEAGFKVFLYPENFIEPELRDDKSPFFKEMEDELNQSDITGDHAQTVFINYLQKLHEVSNLTVTGIYQEKNKNSLNAVLHVIGRSRTAPYLYYYRSYSLVSKTWTCWEKIELDIKGETVIPVVYRHKLHLFWINAIEKIQNNNTKKDDDTQPDKYTEIQLEWSVYKNKKWAPVKVSRKKHIHNGHFSSTSYSLIASAVNGGESIKLCVYCLQNDTSVKFGEFHFNGDVFNAISNLNSFSTGNSEAKFKELTDKMGCDEKPDFSTDEVSSHPYKTLMASRLYAAKESNKDNYTVCLEDDKKLLNTTNSNPNLVPVLHAGEKINTQLYPSFYQDSKLSFFVKASHAKNEEECYTLYPFYHHGTGTFIEELNKKGIDGFLNRELQLETSLVPPPDYTQYENNSKYVNVSYAPEISELVNFSLYGAFSQYNWELFFHAPLYIACKLSQNQKYEEAMRWFHYIFNPIVTSDGEAPQKFWVTKPFSHLMDGSILEQRITNILKSNDTDIRNATAQWLNDPFNPHLVARTRTTAFQKTVVMKYLDNLINWADILFRQDTQESNSEASQLYVLAYQILGKRPVTLPEKDVDMANSKCYDQMANSVDYLSNYGQYATYCLENSLQKATIANQELFNANVTYAPVSAPSSQQNPTDSRSGSSSAQSPSKSYLTGNQTHKPIEAQPIGSVMLAQYPALPPHDPATPYDPPLDDNDNVLDDGGQGQGNDKPDAESSTAITVQGELADVPHITQPNVQLAPHLNRHFCIPYNDRMLQYWDTVEDRLFKLRHCMNIEGIMRELPLFAPPIDPALLVKAAAAGLSIADAMNENNEAMQPHYRFRVILQKAVEFTGEVRQLGDKLLSALEKRDAETLTLVRSSQEVNMQQAVKQVRKLQIDEAKRNIEALAESIKNTEARKAYYESRELMNRLETTAYGLNQTATIITDAVAAGYTFAAIATLFPEFELGGAGAFGSPLAVVKAAGGEKTASSINAAMAALSQISQSLDKHASLLLTKSGYQRRKEEWNFQAQMAGMEINQLNKQLTAAEIRLMVAEKELENLDVQIEQSLSVNEFYKEKFTGEQLYNWMITEVSKIYFSAYKLAYDMAKKAEACYRHELGIYDDKNSSIIQFGHWDSLKQGLLSGDRLMHELHQLDAEYIDKNKRTLELTKHISLAQMFPLKLIELITKGKTEISLEEYLFDMDYPGHYMRRIKSVSVTIPCAAGPYTSVSFMLTLQGARIRKDATGNYNESEPPNDSRFVYQSGITEYICTSSAQNDSGMFELNFGDERYLPFENAGAVSQWKLSFPAGVNQFDLSSVSDVILHINYTALCGGEEFAAKAKDALQRKLPQAGAMMFNLKQDFPDEWNRMSESVTGMSFNIGAGHLPFFLRSKANLKVKVCSVALTGKNDGLANKKIKLNGVEITLGNSKLLGDIYLYSGTAEMPANTLAKGNWTAQFAVDAANIPVSDIADVWIGFGLSEEEQ